MKLQLKGIQKRYGSKEVLRDCSFTFEKGKIYGLLGAKRRRQNDPVQLSHR